MGHLDVRGCSRKVPLISLCEVHGDLEISGQRQIDVGMQRFAQPCSKHVYLLDGCHVIAVAQEHEELALVLLGRCCTPEILQVGQANDARGRPKPHDHKLREVRPWQQPDIVFEGIIPLFRDAFNVQGGHPHPLLRCCPHSTEIGTTLVEPWQWVDLAVVGGEVDFWTPHSRVVKVLSAETVVGTTQTTTTATKATQTAAALTTAPRVGSVATTWVQSAIPSRAAPSSVPRSPPAPPPEPPPKPPPNCTASPEGAALPECTPVGLADSSITVFSRCPRR
jgi:hypothetical protein